ncbi:TetR/AcrR family transcriptional regulator [Pelagibius litoralis]|uniref:TetR/AcrR family transcriptional regulator n=1 Tax=Pelagibius litoralis TaxID=374515 RepID=A0A967EZT2_9PROT|nr:TetR/AcrR family transcriptional regulator [Pelagibius litoralis]NIA70399.1 TetR/AcrR family transcriptional regulator [Pelagibius litoralis]
MLTETAADADETLSPKRTAIIEAAADLFLHSGYGTVSMDAIAAKAEVSKRTVYSHFPGKDVLFAAVMMSHCNRVAGIDCLELDPEADPFAVLCDLGNRFLGLVTSAEAIALFRTVVSETERFPELGQTFFQCGPLRWVENLTPYLTEMNRRGRLDMPDVGDAASKLLHMLKDPMHMRCTLGVQEAASEAEIAAHVEATVADFLKLYAPA